MHQRRAVRTLLASTACALLLVPLAGCGGDGADQDTTSDAAASTAPSESPPASQPGGQSEAVEPQELLDAMKAAFEKNRSTRFSITVPKVMNAKGALSYAGDEVAMDMTMSAPSAGARDLRMVVLDGSVWMAIPGQTPEGKFVEVDATMPGMGDLLSQTEQLGPQGTFDAFDAGLQKVTRVGKEQVGGQTLTHYRLTVDTEAARKAQGKGASSAALPDTLTYDMWLDDQDLMRKVVYTVSGVTATVTMDDWGEDVDIAAPKPADVVRIRPPG